jgi:chaperone BCS1
MNSFKRHIMNMKRARILHLVNAVSASRDIRLNQANRSSLFCLDKRIKTSKCFYNFTSSSKLFSGCQNTQLSQEAMSGASLIDLLASAIRGGIEPEKLFELYIPGFKSLRQFFSAWFRVDLSKVMSFGFFCLLYMTAGRQMLSQAYEHALGYLTSTISIPADERVNREVLTWMSDHIAKRNTRFLAVGSPDGGVKSPYGSGYVSKSDRSSLRRALNSAGMEDERSQPISYFPAMGKVYFMFQSRPFIFDLLPGRYNYNNSEFNAPPTGEEPIILRCLGRNPAPLKVFLEHCRQHCQKSKQSMTTIYTAQLEQYGRRLEWREANVRPVRPLSTVDLAEDLKEDILKDVKRYLHPSTRLFYARRGIPYRRGYLLYGPPGTGKTSFSLALAGNFELDLYMVSLASKNLDDAGLVTLFNALPTKCIVLLEDIDSAGINREIQNEKEPTNRESQKKEKHPISLSGLLNTIDGAASQEGRILIMTSNTPETLDEALIRHGRIDKQIKFDYISRFDAKQLFIRMFSMHQDEKIDVDTKTDSETGILQAMRKVVAGSVTIDVEAYAKEFESKIPEKKLSPAEIQGFLLDHMNDAKGAVEKVSLWISDLLAARLKRNEEAKVNDSGPSTEKVLPIETPPRPHSR